MPIGACPIQAEFGTGRRRPTTVGNITTDNVSQDRDESRTFATIRGHHV